MAVSFALILVVDILPFKQTDALQDINLLLAHTVLEIFQELKERVHQKLTFCYVLFTLISIKFYSPLFRPACLLQNIDILKNVLSIH